MWDQATMSPDDWNLVQDHQLHIAFIWGILTGAQGEIGVSGMSISAVIDSEQVERFIIFRHMDELEVDSWLQYVEIHDQRQSNKVPCNGLDTDNTYDTCADLAQSNYDCRYDKNKDFESKGVTLGIIGAVITCPFAIFPNPTTPVATPLCVASVVTAAGGALCGSLEESASMADYDNSLHCCCTALKCRINGQGNCPTSVDCNSKGCTRENCNF